MADTDIERNAASANTLAELTARLSEDDLGRSLGGGWTVASALVHLTFWDGRQDAALRHYTATGQRLEDDSDDAVNEGLGPLLAHIDPASAVTLATAAAKAVDATIAGLAPDVREALLATDDAYQVQRWSHREEHIAQIEAVLG
ncbi:MAG: maleylpyruvate isomerase N-terminal domain-containing protein [Dehalococcoidia bacterium]